MAHDRSRIEVHGTVQGVGFRPFVHRLARALNLDGAVRNVGGHVVIEAAGESQALTLLLAGLREQAPPQAAVTRVLTTAWDGPDVAPGSGFVISASAPVEQAGGAGAPPDTATCLDCLRELFDPADRRYRYPFVNCVSCGPRATIIDALPYDRARTAMSGFRLCAQCEAEYRDPDDRRFHAEPIACPACGPHLSWRQVALTPATPLAKEQALSAAVALVAAGGILALKGLGGYQLVCDATRSEAVARLRRRKRRPDKPFAVMARDLIAARVLARLTHAEADLLCSPARPIVLADARPGGGGVASEAVHPGLGRLGVFLPTTPVHHLLLADLARPLVVTSGNLADEPIAVDERDARGLEAIADGFLEHDRPIRARYDDSVTQVAAGRPRVLRRARGYAPAPLPLPLPTPSPLLAVGAQLKHTFTIASGGQAVIGPHTGDLGDVQTVEAFTTHLAHLSEVYGVEPRLVVHDAHPGYRSTAFARAWPASQRIAVQHHHAHVASCAAEHGLAGPVIGVAYDGLGLGDDGTFWGGEILLADLLGYERLGRFATAPLPGGEAAVRHPARMALGYLFGGEALGAAPIDAQTRARFLDELDPVETRVTRQMIARSLNSPRASSAGRLFDAVAALLGVSGEISYEAQAATLLESLADQVGPGARSELPWRLVEADGLWVYDPTPTLAAVLAQRAAGVEPAQVAAAFHHTLASVTVALVERAATRCQARDVCLSGGVFANRRLLELTERELSRQGFHVYANSQTPAGDGGVSFGQAAVAAARAKGA